MLSLTEDVSVLRELSKWENEYGEATQDRYVTISNLFGAFGPTNFIYWGHRRVHPQLKNNPYEFYQIVYVLPRDNDIDDIDDECETLSGFTEDKRVLNKVRYIRDNFDPRWRWIGTDFIKVKDRWDCLEAWEGRDGGWVSVTKPFQTTAGCKQSGNSSLSQPN